MSSTGRPEGGRPGGARSGGEHSGGEMPRGASTGDSARCPFCGSVETERIALFGSTLLVSQHFCRACRTVFEKLKR